MFLVVGFPFCFVIVADIEVGEISKLPSEAVIFYCPSLCHFPLFTIKGFYINEVTKTQKNLWQLNSSGENFKVLVISSK